MAFKESQGFGEWVDVMVRLKGQIVWSLSYEFTTDYEGGYTKADLGVLSDEVGELPNVCGERHRETIVTP